MSIQVLSPQALKVALASTTPPLVIDVRTKSEHDIAHLAPSVLLPMDEITSRWSELPRDRDLVLICHHGIRSMHVAMWLESKGFTRLFNLTGGLDQWSLQIDPNIPRY